MPRNMTTTIALLRNATALGSWRAPHQLFLILADGLYGAPRDAAAAAEAFRTFLALSSGWRDSGREAAERHAGARRGAEVGGAREMRPPFGAGGVGGPATLCSVPTGKSASAAPTRPPARDRPTRPPAPPLHLLPAEGDAWGASVRYALLAEQGCHSALLNLAWLMHRAGAAGGVDVGPQPDALALPLWLRAAALNQTEGMLMAAHALSKGDAWGLPGGEPWGAAATCARGGALKQPRRAHHLETPCATCCKHASRRAEPRAASLGLLLTRRLPLPLPLPLPSLFCQAPTWMARQRCTVRQQRQGPSRACSPWAG